MKLAFIQYNTILADFAGNCGQLLQHLAVARQKKADLCLAPALALCGYGAKALCERIDFVAEHKKILMHFTLEHAKQQLPPVLLGCIGLSEKKDEQCIVLVKDGTYHIVPSYAEAQCDFSPVQKPPSCVTLPVSFVTFAGHTFALALAHNVFVYEGMQDQNNSQSHHQNNSPNNCPNSSPNNSPKDHQSHAQTQSHNSSHNQIQPQQQNQLQSQRRDEPQLQSQRRDEPQFFLAPSLYSLRGVVAQQAEENTKPANGNLLPKVQGIFIFGAEPFIQETCEHVAPCLAALADHTGLPVVFVNLVGGTDGHICFGGSGIYAAHNGVDTAHNGVDTAHNGVYTAPYFEEALITASLATQSNEGLAPIDVTLFQDQLCTSFVRPAGSLSVCDSLRASNSLSTCESLRASGSLSTCDSLSFIWQALVLGTRDYMQKNAFSKVVLGLSGGIDSALVAAIAVDALGAENVTGVLLPSLWSSQGSIDDSLLLAKNLAMATYTLPIAHMFAEQQQAFEQAFFTNPSKIALENMQARLRGLMLMAYANTMGALMLPTSNKSELAVGYCTLYGDMCGGFFILGDVYKTQVFDLCYWLNTQKGYAHIPVNILEKEPSAELHPGQKDNDSLPEYAVLDPLLKGLWEEKLSFDCLEEKGFARKDIERISYLLHVSEFKRRQAAFSLQVSHFPLRKNEQPFLTQKYMKH